jgi:hypothetical protein
MCPATNEWMKKMCYIKTMEYKSPIKKNEIRSFVGKWIELEIIMLSKISSAQKDKHYGFAHMGNVDLK